MIGPAPRRVEHARAVGVHLVVRPAEVVVPLQLEVVARHHRRVAHQQLGAGHVELQPVVGVRQVGAGRQQHRHVVAPAVTPGPDDERHVALGLALPQPDGVDAALEVARQVDAERLGPLRVVQVVVVEVDRAVLVRGVPEVRLAARPVVARHGPGRAVGADGVEAAARDVDDGVQQRAVGAVGAREVPLRERRRAVGDVGRRVDARVPDLAVEVADALREPDVAGRAGADAERHGGHGGRKRHAEALRVAAGAGCAGQQVRADGLDGGIDPKRRVAGGRVERGDQAVPRVRLDQRVAREARAGALAVAEDERRAPVLEQHGVAGEAAVVPGAEQVLHRLVRRGRLERELDRPRDQGRQHAAVAGHRHVRAGVGMVEGAGIRAVRGRLELGLEEAGTVGPLEAVAQPDEMRRVALDLLAADVDRHALARREAELRRVAEDRRCRLDGCVSHCAAPRPGAGRSCGAPPRRR